MQFLFLNVYEIKIFLYQAGLGVPLEMVHGSGRVAMIYISGVSERCDVYGDVYISGCDHKSGRW